VDACKALCKTDRDSFLAPLKNSAEAARLTFLACLHLQRFTSATSWYELAVSCESNPANAK
jgi:hypothetical protein